MNSQKNTILALAALVLLSTTDVASAASSNLPWVRVISILVDSLTNEVVQGGIIASIVVFGLMLAFGDPGPLWKRMFQVIFGLSIAAGAASIAGTLFPISSGATF